MVSGISLVLFIFLGILAFSLARKTDMKNPIYIIFLLATGLFRPSADLPGGFDLSSMWLLLNILLLLIVYLRNTASFSGVTMIARIYLIYLFYVIISTIPQIGETTSFEFSLRMLLKLIYPLFVLIVTAKVFRINDYLDIAISKTLIATFIASIFIGGFAQRYLAFISGNFAPFTWFDAAFSDHSAIITSLALIWWVVTRKKEYLFLGIWLCVSTILMSNRTGIAATFIGIFFFMLLRFGIIRALPFVLALYFAGMSILFLSPGLHDKMFVTGQTVDAKGIIEKPTDIDFGTIESSGRFELWEYLLDEFWRPRPLTGSGLGAAQKFLYSFQNLTRLNHPHSSYVKILCDSGLIGLCLFVSIHLSCMLSAYRILKSQATEKAKIAARFVMCAVPSLLFIMGFDSGINCATAIMQYSFIFSGIMIGLSQQDNEEPEVQ